MKLHRVLAVSRKTFLTLRHDPRSVGLMLLAPIMAMLVFGFAFGTEVSNVKTAVVNLDEGDLAAELVAHLDRDALDLREGLGVEEARRLVRDGEAVAALVFPANFTEDATPQGGSAGQPGATPLQSGQPPTPPRPPKGARVEVVLDTTNNQLSSVVLRELGEAAQALAASRNQSAPVSFDVAYSFEEARDARFIDYFVPGIMAFAALLFTTLLTLLAFVQERTLGTLDRLRVTPATEGEIVTGYALAFGVVGAVQGLLLLGAAMLLFDVLVVGSVALAALVVVLLAVDAQALGILVSAAAQREGQAVQFLPFFVLPTFLLSGIFVPVESLPGWLEPLAYLLPPTWAVEALRDVMLRGWGLDRVWPHLAVLAGFAVAFISLAVVGLRRARR